MYIAVPLTTMRRKAASPSNFETALEENRMYLLTLILGLVIASAPFQIIEPVKGDETKDDGKYECTVPCDINDKDCRCVEEEEKK